MAYSSNIRQAIWYLWYIPKHGHISDVAHLPCIWIDEDPDAVIHNIAYINFYTVAQWYFLWFLSFFFLIACNIYYVFLLFWPFWQDCCNGTQIPIYSFKDLFPEHRWIIWNPLLPHVVWLGYYFVLGTPNFQLLVYYPVKKILKSLPEVLEEDGRMFWKMYNTIFLPYTLS